MASVDEQSVIECCTTDRAEVEEVQIIDEVKDAGKKLLKFIPIEGSSQSEKDRFINSRKMIKPPKNIILVEGNPIDDMGVQKKRQMRCFPTEELLSAKIKMANGTDYSNDFIEQHYNPRLSNLRKKCKKQSQKIGKVGLSNMKKISLDDLGLEFEKKKTNSSPEIIDLSDNSNEVGIFGCSKNVEDSSIDKFSKKLKNTAIFPRLVSYSSSEDEKDDCSDAISSPTTNLKESKEILKSRQHFIREGMDENIFKFEKKTATDGSGKKIGIRKSEKRSLQID